MFLVAIMLGKMPTLAFILNTVQEKCNFVAGRNMVNIWVGFTLFTGHEGP
jgi:hypothetical protein